MSADYLLPILSGVWIIIGVVIAFSLTIYRDWRKEANDKRIVARLLTNEVDSLSSLAKQIYSSNKKKLETGKQDVKKGIPFSIHMRTVPFRTRVYESFLREVGLFPFETIERLRRFYADVDNVEYSMRWCEEVSQRVMASDSLPEKMVDSKRVIITYEMALRLLKTLGDRSGIVKKDLSKYLGDPEKGAPKQESAKQDKKK